MAFAGGAFDAVMQLGVAHALLVSGGRTPDVIVGISVGAINAAAVAEILQAGTSNPEVSDGDAAPHQTRDRRRVAQVARFRAFLNAYLDAPSGLVRSLLPDLYEVEAKTALHAQRLPIHSEEERDERETSIVSRYGLVRLLNGILSLRLTLGSVVKLAAACLRVQAIADRRGPVARLQRGWRKLFVWLRLGLLIPNLSRPAMTVVNLWIGRRLRWFGFHPTTDAAERAVLRPRLFRSLHAAAVWLIGLLILSLLWLTVPLVVAIGRLLLRFSPRFLLRIKGRKCAERQNLLDQVLQAFFLDKDLGDTHFLKQLLVPLFDPDYYGRPSLDEIVEAGLRGEGSRPPSPGASAHVMKRLRDYLTAGTGSPIHVVPVAADVATGALVTVHRDTPVVDALLAATAVVPWFRSQRVGTGNATTGVPRWCIDGVNVANEPTTAVMHLLRDRLNPDVSAVHVYPVSPLPLALPELAATNEGRYHGSVEVVLRARQLNRFGNAQLERKVASLYSRLLPVDQPVVDVHPENDENAASERRRFVGATFHPIDAERSLNLNERLMLQREPITLRQMMLEAVADGCRSTLQTMMPAVIEGLHGGAGHVPCAKAVAAYRGDQKAALPGGDISLHPPGPGLSEVCEHCALRRGAEGPAVGKRPTPRVLALPLLGRATHEWPRGQWLAQPIKTVADDSQVRTSSAGPSQAGGSGKPPRTPGSAADETKVWTSALFSGGVFRGVFQVGVVTAMSELGLAPNVIAGASVGSIMSAMAARVFSSSDRRVERLNGIAATFLALDRLVKTDRLYDFYQKVLLRFADVKVSPADLDEVFRRYDEPTSLASRQWRRVLAGVERSLYISPFELAELAKAIRRGETAETAGLICQHLQKFLNWNGVGTQILGAEPLALLIAERVLERSRAENSALGDGKSVRFDHFNRADRHLMATVTNLTLGKLEVFGEPLWGYEPDYPNLIDALLASSAFPAVFRPRWSWEVYPEASFEAQYADGGIMDNLPVDAVARFLTYKASRKAIPRRPRKDGRPIPHLLLTASLEVDPEALNDAAAERTAKSWRKLRKRAAQLTYNKKIDDFANAQRDFRLLYERGLRPGGWEPIDIEVMIVKPRWLPNTFAFDKLLGFSRARQAASIAHGCACTMAKFQLVAGDHPDWASAWRGEGAPPTRIDEQAVDLLVNGVELADDSSIRTRVAQRGKSGTCWLRDEYRCPFSGVASSPAHTEGAAAPSETEKGLREIYEACGKKATHQGPR
ncbi:MAG TPA: patatin-like phospholipase family protein [Tepidisphaeraceae bacterium]|nr:patatin-like phospholipase family protein [Tepidisphaeraceae bacterium]